jgi:hypothetical protein
MSWDRAHHGTDAALRERSVSVGTRRLDHRLLLQAPVPRDGGRDRTGAERLAEDCPPRGIPISTCTTTEAPAAKEGLARAVRVFQPAPDWDCVPDRPRNLETLMRSRICLAKAVPGDEYGRMVEVTSVAEAKVFPGTLFLQDDKVVLVSVDHDAFLESRSPPSPGSVTTGSGFDHERETMPSCGCMPNRASPTRYTGRGSTSSRCSGLAHMLHTKPRSTASPFLSVKERASNVTSPACEGPHDCRPM